MTWLYRIAVAAIFLFALRKGGEPERLVVTIIVAAAVLDGANHVMFGDPVFFAVNPGHLVIDTWAMLSMLWIALKANRGWPLWACAAQIIVVIGHVSKLIDLSVVRYGYFAMMQLPISIQAGAILAGTYAHVRRVERIGHYHAWRLAH